MSSTVVSTVSSTLQPGKNLIEREYISELLHKNSSQIPAQETKQPEKKISNGITLQSHQAINEIIQRENASHFKEDGIGSDTVSEDSVKRFDNESETVQRREGEREREREKIPEKSTPSAIEGKDKQDRLLLDGPGQRYRLEKGGEIPELNTDREILIQVSPTPLGTFQYLRVS